MIVNNFLKWYLILCVDNVQYYFEGENEYIMSSVIKEDSEFDDGEYARYSDPRIRRTKYMKMDDKDGDKFDDNYKEFNFEYRYDNLGRLTEKNSEKIEHDSGVLYNKRYLNLSKQIGFVAELSMKSIHIALLMHDYRRILPVDETVVHHARIEYSIAVNRLKHALK